jgi:hypothetical protein
MKYTLPIDTDEAYDWAYENGLSKVNAGQAEWLANNDLWREDYCPAEIEIEFDVIPEGSTLHAYGSTYVSELHSAVIVSVEVDGKPVTMPTWLESKLMETV